MFGSNARRAPVVTQPPQLRPPTPTTPSNNSPTTNQQNSNNAQNSTPPRCPQILENFRKRGILELIAGSISPGRAAGS